MPPLCNVIVCNEKDNRTVPSSIFLYISRQPLARIFLYLEHNLISWHNLSLQNTIPQCQIPGSRAGFRVKNKVTLTSKFYGKVL